MGKSLKDFNSDCFHSKNAYKRFIRLEDAMEKFQMNEDNLMYYAREAKAAYQLPKTLLFNCWKMEDYMKHLYKVQGTEKYVQKKYVRIGEGSIMYSIGHHRFIEMARAAGAVYKLGKCQSNTILISLDIFDEYMEQFREPKKELRIPLRRDV